MTASLLTKFLISVGLSLLVTMLLTKWLSGQNSWANGLDYPRQQSLHQTPISRLGGIAILGGVLAGLFCLSMEAEQLALPVSVLVGLVALASVSLWDDLTAIAAWKRLVVQLACALLVVWPRPVPSCLEVIGWLGCLPVWPSVICLAVGIVWMINLYNFMDGADGIAAGMAAIGFTALGVMGLLAAHDVFAVAAFVVAAAAVGFLFWNFPPASIFMGDAGSTSLGFLAAALIFWGTGQNLFPLEAGVMIFAPFIVDATVTLCRRMYRRERIWQPHRTHYYQRLILAGYGVRSVLTGYYSLMLASGLGAILLVRLEGSERSLLLAAMAGFYTLLLCLAECWLLRRRVATS